MTRVLVLPHFKGWLGWALIAWLLSGCASTFPDADGAKIARLLGLIAERLNLAPEIARAKWNSQVPIEDRPRERQLIEGAVQRAGEYHLDPRRVRAFFTGQIEASKVIQNALHAEWTAQRRPPFAKVADLGNELRPALDRLTAALLQTLADALPVLQRPGGRRLLEEQSKTIRVAAPGSEEAISLAVRPLLSASEN